MKSIIEEIQKSIDAFSVTVDLPVSFNDLLGVLEADETSLRDENVQHLNNFCMEVKKMFYIQCFQHCKSFCLSHLQVDPEIYIKSCHAQASEVVVPFFRKQEISCIMYIGPFREPGSERSAFNNDENLKSFSKNDSEQIVIMASMMQKHIQELLNKLEKEKEEQRTDPKLTAIRSFINNRYQDSVELQDLADNLDLSRSRTSHVIKQITGKSFSKLIAEKRIWRAQVLLVQTDKAINAIAEECGFASSSYFCSYFKKETSMSPLDFRMEGYRLS